MHNTQQSQRFAASEQDDDEKAIRQIVQSWEDAWNAGDSKAWVANMVEDVYFTVWNGLFVEGQEANERAHHQLFNTIFKGTRHKFTVRWVRFLRPDVAAVQWDADRTGNDTIPKVRPLAVLTKQDGRWQVEVFQNTPILNQPISNVTNTHE